eukprot:222929-Pelagomonas_calceolata.AAC.7
MPKYEPAPCPSQPFTRPLDCTSCLAPRAVDNRFLTLAAAHDVDHLLTDLGARGKAASKGCTEGGLGQGFLISQDAGL